MLIQTILNRVQKFKSFVYRQVRWVGSGEQGELEVEVHERANGHPLCSGCGCRRPGYDRLSTHRFEFVPLWGIKVFLVYAPRRVNCPDCGVRVEAMPWALGKSSLTQRCPASHLKIGTNYRGLSGSTGHSPVRGNS